MRHLLATVLGMNRAFLVCMLFLALTTAGAKVYKSVLPDGSVVYSDTPPSDGATPVELPAIQYYAPPPLPPPSEEGASAAKPTAAGYETFEIASPSDDQAVRDNGGTVSIQLTLVPGLRSGHQIEIFMDGASLGSGAATTASITNVDRGSHSVHAVVRDGDGKELARTGAITFHLLRASRLN